MERFILSLSGMSCGHCVAAVTKALRAVEGIEVEQVGVGTATIRLDPSRTSREAIARVLDDIGYGVTATATA